MISLTPTVDGSVIAFFVDDTDLVEEGQLLVTLDSTPYSLTYQKELSKLSSIILKVKELYDNVITATIDVKNKSILLSKAQYDFDNRTNLISSLAISNEDYTHSKDDLTVAQLDLLHAESILQTAIDLAGKTPPQYHPMIEEQKAVILKAFYHLQHCFIYAPATGFIAQRAVEVGDTVSTKTPLLAIIPTDYMWVDANFKETQLKKMRIGQSADVWFDLYGSKIRFEGKVLGIASGTGSVFSLIPPQNATGNWIKIVQRLPVRISLDPKVMKKYPLRLGISAEVNVDITNQDLDYLPTIPAKKTVGKTSIFEIDFSSAEEEINKIINDHFGVTPSV
jgi:membrane fusion protein (multidrug efflux system)